MKPTRLEEQLAAVISGWVNGLHWRLQLGEWVPRSPAVLS